MKFGICSDASKIKDVKALGFDYIELPLNKIGVLSDEDFSVFYRDFESADLPCPACSLLLPKTMKVIGDEYNQEELDNYLNVAFSRMNRIGARIISFGSGKSRFVPCGMSYKDAYRQLVDVTSHMVEIADKYSIEIAIEPLNRGETNLINLLTEGAALSSLTGASLLSDAFHIRKENEPVEDVALCAPIAHAHIATLDGRRFPLKMDEEVMGFISQLKRIDYQGNLSIEGKTDDLYKDAPVALEVLRKAYKEA